MNATVFILLIYTLFATIPFIKKKNILNIEVSKITIPFYILLSSIVIFTNSSGNLSENFFVALLLIYLMIDRFNDVTCKSFTINGAVLLVISFLVLYSKSSAWLTFSLVSLILLSSKKYKGYLSAVPLIALFMPAYPKFAQVYYEWGGLLLVPIFFGIIKKEKKYDRLLYAYLYFIIIFNTNYFSLGYSPIIALGLSLVLFITDLNSGEESFIYTLAMIPFIGLGSKYNILGVFLLFEIIIFLKMKILSTIQNIEIDSDGIKKIKYLDLILIFLSLYLLFSAPGSPLVWIFSRVSEHQYLLGFFLIIEIFLLNQSVLKAWKSNINIGKVNDLNEYIIPFIYLILIVIGVRSSIFTRTFLGFYLGLPFVLLVILIKKKNTIVDRMIMFKSNISVPFKYTEVGSTKSIIDTPRERLNKNFDLRFSGLEENIVWSLFIFIISVILIGKYL